MISKEDAIEALRTLENNEILAEPLTNILKQIRVCIEQLKKGDDVFGTDIEIKED